MAIRERRTDDRLHPVQLEILRRMTEEQRLRLADELSAAVLEMRLTNLESELPGATPRELLLRLASSLYGPELAKAAYGQSE